MKPVQQKALLVALLCSHLFLLSCASSTATPTHKPYWTESDIPGHYAGVFPCAGCAGIRANLQFNEDHSVTSNYTFVGSNKPDQRYTNSWEIEGNLIVIEHAADNLPTYYLRPYHHGQQLVLVDKDGYSFSGDLSAYYVMHKIPSQFNGENQPDNELNGEWSVSFIGLSPFNPSQPTKLGFSAEKNKFWGNTGCNNIGGQFFASDNSMLFNIKYSTKMACQDMDEQKVTELIETIDGYKVERDKLYLYKQGETVVVAQKISQKDSSVSPPK